MGAYFREHPLMLLLALFALAFAIILWLKNMGVNIHFDFLVDYIKSLNFKKSGLKMCMKGKESGCLYGKKMGLYVCSIPQWEGHSLVLGGSGTGKTSAILIPTLNAWGDSNSSFTIDISGDIAKNCRIKNKIVFNPDNPRTIPYDVFKPIDDIKEKSEKIDELKKLATLLRPIYESDVKSGGGKYYAEGAQDILAAALISGYFYGKDFVPICKWICGSDSADLVRDIKEIGEPVAVTLITPYIDTSSNNVIGCFSEARKTVKLFATNKRLENCLRRSENSRMFFSPKQIEYKNCFVQINQSRLSLYQPLLHIIVAQTLNFFMNRPLNFNKQILLCLDEFAALGHLEMLDALRTYRKRGVRIMILTQSLADMDLIYSEKERNSMINNFKFKVVLSAEDTESQRFIADLIGKKKSEDNPIHEEYIIPPEKLGRLKNKLVLIYPDGHMILRKNYYFKKSLIERIIS